MRAQQLSLGTRTAMALISTSIRAFRCHRGPRARTAIVHRARADGAAPPETRGRRRARLPSAPGQTTARGPRADD
eukprot:COSAG01_NODE_3141_length_6525_cov_13.027077_7_plen_74_part_01